MSDLRTVMLLLGLMDKNTEIAISQKDNELDDIAVSALAAAASGKETVLKTRMKSYVESVVPLYLSDDFKSHFRLSRQTAEVQMYYNVV